MNRPGQRRVARLAAIVATVVGSATIRSGAVLGQNPVVAATLEPDTILVGTVFALDLWVDLPAGGEVRFPAVLELPEDLEQRDAVKVESNDRGKSWRARYTLSAWSADSLSISPVVASVVSATGEEFPITIVAPMVVVGSILPADVADLELRDARPFLRVRSFPWWFVILSAVGLAAAYLLWRRRRGPRVVFAPTGPAQLALRDLERLRNEWGAGSLAVGEFYDRYEHALRRYARATRRWAPSRSLIGIGVGGDLLSVLRRSAFVRFAHLRAPEGAPETAIEAGEHFIRSEMPAEDEPAEQTP